MERLIHTPPLTPPQGGERMPAKPKVDMDHVNAWCIKHGYLKKKLDNYTYSELPKLVSQFEEVYRGYLRSIH